MVWLRALGIGPTRRHVIAWRGTLFFSFSLLQYAMHSIIIIPFRLWGSSKHLRCTSTPSTNHLRPSGHSNGALICRFPYQMWSRLHECQLSITAEHLGWSSPRHLLLGTLQNIMYRGPSISTSVCHCPWLHIYFLGCFVPDFQGCILQVNPGWSQKTTRTPISCIRQWFVAVERIGDVKRLEKSVARLCGRVSPPHIHAVACLIRIGSIHAYRANVYTSESYQLNLHYHVLSSEARPWICSATDRGITYEELIAAAGGGRPCGG